jgi:hypothetical protein
MMGCVDVSKLVTFCLGKTDDVASSVAQIQLDVYASSAGILDTCLGIQVAFKICNFLKKYPACLGSFPQNNASSHLNAA